MLKTFLLAGLITAGLAAQAPAQAVPPPPGPYPDEGVFCAPFRLCQPDLVTRAGG